MKKWSLKKRIIFISAIVVIIGALVYPTYKLVKYVRYVDSYGADTMEEVVERFLVSDSYREYKKIEYPSKIFKKQYNDLWKTYYENNTYYDIDHDRDKLTCCYGYKDEVRNIKIIKKEGTEKEMQYLIEHQLDDLIEYGAEIEEAYEIKIDYEYRCRYDYDESTVSDGIKKYYSPNGDWSDWKKSEWDDLIVYKIGKKWYVIDVGE